MGIAYYEEHKYDRDMILGLMAIGFDGQTTALGKYETKKVFPGRVCRGAYHHFKS